MIAATHEYINVFHTEGQNHCIAVVFPPIFYIVCEKESLCRGSRHPFLTLFPQFKAKDSLPALLKRLFLILTDESKYLPKGH